MDKKIFLVLKTAEKPDVDYTEERLEEWASNDADYNNSDSIIKIDANKYDDVNEAVEAEIGEDISEILKEYRVYAFNFEESRHVVYVVCIHQVVESDDLGIHLEVFQSRDDARAYLKEWRDDEIQYVERDEWKIFKDTPDHFEASQMLDWLHNHTEGFIEEKTIK